MNVNNYGFIFNDIKVNNNKLIKTAKNEYGKEKIQNEINFYEYIIDNKIIFSIPRIYLLNKNEGIIEMEYLKNCNTITDIFYEFELNYIINKILTDIKILHNFSYFKVSKETYIESIRIETRDKILLRYNETDWNNISFFNKIKTVNNISFKNIYFYVNKINEELLKYINENMEDFYFCLIHGDIHLGNILINKTNDKNDIYFIDPRGYFGNNKLFGIKEYDYAKLLFGISGYSIFDKMEIESLNIVDNNIDIDFISEYCKIYDNDKFDNFTKLLSLSIWLGNNNNFINKKKKLTSLMISYYLCEKYLKY